MLVLFATVLILHGLAHLVGFAGSWRLSENMPRRLRTTALGARI